MSSPTASTSTGTPADADASGSEKPTFVPPHAADVPAPPDGELQVAALRRRAVGFVIDVVLFTIVTAIGAAIAIALANAVRESGQPPASDGARHAAVLIRVIGISIAAALGLWLVWVRTPTRDQTQWGQTFGGRALNLRVVRRDGTALTKGRAARRIALPGTMIVLASPAALVVGLTTDFSDEAFNHGYAAFALTAMALGVISFALRLIGGRRATLNDRLSGTVTVDAELTDPAPRPGSTTPLVIAPRSKTASTYALALLTALVCAAMLAGALPEAFKDLRDRGTSAGLGFDATTTAGAQRKTTLVAKSVAACIEAKGDATDCDTEDALDLPKGVELGSFFDTAPGTTLVLSTDDSQVVIATLSENGKLWGIAQGDDGSATKVCLNSDQETLCNGGFGW